MGILKAMPVILTIALLLVGTMAMGVSARIEGRWALQTGDLIVGEDISIQKPMAAIFHQQTASMLDIEHMSINFPISADNLGLGPSSLGLGVADADSNTGGVAGAAGADGNDPFGSGFALNSADALGAGASATANVLPFGPVNLAFPEIHTDATQDITTTSTGFFQANWAYISDTASGNMGSEPLGTHLASGHPFKSNKMLGSEFIWPMMIPIASASSGSLGFDADSLAPGLVPDVPPLDMSVGVLKYDNNISSGLNGTSNITRGSEPTVGATNNTDKQKPAGWGTRKPRVNPKATKDEIKNMTTTKRVYRNAFIGSSMHNAYEGPTQYPLWIDPYDNGRGCFNQCSKPKILEIALQKTRPGERIAPVFWDL